MPTVLRIGAVAALLGISTKTIRYYHSVGLLAEPARAANGYRVYTAHDLVRLQRIRRLQALGLPLKSIREVLDTGNGGDHIHAVLHALLGEVDQEIAALRARRTRIVAALAADAETVAGASPTFAALEAHLAPYLTDEHAALLEQERQLWAVLDAAQPPDDVHTLGETLAAQLAAHPAETQALLEWSERLSALSATQVDDPALEQLARAFVQSSAFQWLSALRNTQPSAPTNAAANTVWSALAADALTPAQQRFFQLVQFAAETMPEEVTDAATHV